MTSMELCVHIVFMIIYPRVSGMQNDLLTSVKLKYTENVSKIQTEIESVTFLWPLRRSDPWATKTLIDSEGYKCGLDRLMHLHAASVVTSTSCSNSESFSYIFHNKSYLGLVEELSSICTNRNFFRNSDQVVNNLGYFTPTLFQI